MTSCVEVNMAVSLLAAQKQHMSYYITWMLVVHVLFELHKYLPTQPFIDGDL